EAQQLTLFKDRKYAYHVLVTNLATHLEGVEVLRQKSDHREKYPRTALRLPLGKDSHRRLGGQCGFLPDTLVGLRPGALVQAARLAQPLSLCHPEYDSYRFSGLARQTHQPKR